MPAARVAVTAFAAVVALSLLNAAAVLALPGPASFATGFVDEASFQSTDAAVRTVWFGRAHALGSTWVRLGAYWNQIAPAQPASGFDAANPSDPGYDFSRLDAAIRAASDAHQHVLVQLLAPPTWALGTGAPPGAVAGTWRPSPTALAAFAHAVALRYSGRFGTPRLPRVAAFQVWNEPNLRTYLSPQWIRGRGGAWRAASPGIYRRLLNVAYRAIKAVQPHALVMAAGTAPYGDPPGGDRMAPALFWRELVCLRGPQLQRERCPDPPHFDAVDHHPYSLSPTHHAFAPDDISVPDIGRLQRILRAAVRDRTVIPARAKPIWVTEIFWDSDPPDPASRISLATQAHDLSLAFYELWRQGVGHVLWFTLRDIAYEGLTGAGVYFADGAAKPSAAACRFPFVALRGRDGAVTLWGRAPARGVVTIERSAGHRWRVVTRVRTTVGGVFYAVRQIGGRPTLRARAHGVASLAFPG